jgi:inner membrane protein
MLGKQHLLFGTVTGIATVITLNQLGVIDETGMYEFTGMAMLGSLLPDIDMTTSTIGRILKPVSFILSKAIGHRTYTHDVFLNIILCVISMLYMKNNYMMYLPLATGLWFGIFGHLLLDSFTVNGLPVLYLFNKKNIHILPYRLRVYSSEDNAKYLTVLLIAVGIGINLLVLKNTVGLTF